MIEPLYNPPRPVAWAEITAAVWEPPEELPPSQWVLRHRELRGGQTDTPGPWTHEQAPYLVGLMDLMAAPEIEEVWIEKAAQIGGSECVRCYLAWALANDPGPMLCVLPDEKRGREVFADNILPLCEEPGLRALVARGRSDQTLTVVRFINGARLRLGWARSPSALATHPARVVWGDEVDKFPSYSGRESSPINLMRARTKRYRATAKRIFISTPTTADGPIHRGREQCAVQLRYWIPCPHCDRFSEASFFDQLVWPAAEEEDQYRHAARIAALGLVHAVCRHCKGIWKPEQQGDLARAGVWAHVDYGPQLTRDEAAAAGMGGVVRSAWPAGNSVGCVLPELVCPWAPWARTVAAFLAAQGDQAALMEFRNQRLAEPFESQLVHHASDIYDEKSQRPGPPEGVLPRWTRRVLATCDVQENRVYVVIRAWGPHYLSRRIRHMELPSPRGDPQAFRTLYAETLAARFEVEGGGGTRGVDLLLIDARYRKEEVWTFALRDTQRIRPIYGSSETDILGVVRHRAVTHTPPGSGRQFKLFSYEVDVDQCKDWMAGQVDATVRIEDERGEMVEHEAWQLCGPSDPDYNRQMASEQKVLIRRGGAQPVERWQKVSAGAANHYWDCEAYQRAAAQMARIEMEGRAGGRRSWKDRLQRR